VSESARGRGSGNGAAKRSRLSQRAAEQLRRRILVGMAIILLLNGGVGTAVAVGGGVDPSVLIGFTPDLAVGSSLLWLVLRRQWIRPAIGILAVYFAVTFTFFSVQLGGLMVFATPWPIVPILFGLYVGGHRLAWCMAGVMALDAGLAATVAWSGRGLELMQMPSLETPAGQMLAMVGSCFVLVCVSAAAHSRARTQREFEALLVELDEQDRRLQTLVRNTSDATVLLDPDYRILAGNPAAEQLVRSLSGDRGTLVGQSFLDIVAPGRADIWAARLRDCTTKGRIRFEETLDGASGARHVETSVHAVVVRGQHVGFTLFARDITERRDAEAAMQRLRGQLLEASRLAGRAEVASGVLHNVGNVLNSVNVSVSEMRTAADRMRVDSLRKVAGLLAEEIGDEPTPKRAKALTLLHALVDHIGDERERLLDEANRLGERLKHIHAILRAQQKLARTREVVEEVDVDELIRSALPLDESWREAGIELSCEVEQPVPRLVCDRHKLLQILVNLLRNARDAVREMPAGTGRVLVRGRTTEGGRVSMAVVDNGIGIALEHRERIFGHGFTTKEDGHGFGLHSSALLAAELGGTLRFESDGPGRGTTFTLELPAASAQIAVA
jgi:PAS domain S-box-containing protein